MTSAPSAASRTACARPWPRAAPVMKATLPSSLRAVMGILLRVGQHGTPGAPAPDPAESTALTARLSTALTCPHTGPVSSPVDPPPGTRDVIGRHARVLFAERGYAATSVRGIAAAAGVDPALVIRH